jgi:squalene-associated FAD-dependent desaturase
MSGTVHIIGGGLAGLSAAVNLTARGRKAIVHEATAFAGGRCRSYVDTVLGITIDNGNHLLLSANHAALDYLKTIGAQDRLRGPASAEFDFAELPSGERWKLRMNDGRIPFWLFDRNARVPGTGVIDYLPLGKILFAGRNKTIGETIRCEGTLYRRLVEPLMLAALNIDPPRGSAKLAGAIVRETLAAGGRACRPLIAREGLGATLVEPALAWLKANGATVNMQHELRAVNFGAGRIDALDFGGGDTVTLGAGDAVILAVPPYAASSLVKGIEGPTEFRAIVNAHFRIDPPAGQPAIVGVIGGLVEWLFAFPGRLSVTISAGDRLIGDNREALAKSIWSEVAKLTGLPDTLPPWQIVRERRATFAATPEQDARRPGARTAWRNLALAGDWTDTGLPATIEGAIRSGSRAADLIA